MGIPGGSISHILQPDNITAGSILLADNLVALKRDNPYPILALKRTEWREFIDYFVLKRTYFLSILGINQDLHL